MKGYSDEQILKGILRHDNLILQYIYKQYYYRVNYFIKKNQGNEEDASDLFQEAVIVIYRKLKENDLIFEKSSFQGYLFAVCRFLWLKQLEKRRIEKEKINDTLPFQENIYDDNLVDLVDKNEKYGLYQKHFKTLSSDCQKLLQMFFDKIPLREIAKIMGYKGEKYAKTRKYKCKELLISRIKQDSEYKKILEDDT
ncbi:MAG: sigma-70 family RNA polymerase sigma factor [Prolixibacteraceae bacterium]|jgi:RNA polymerase sigma factor (sigma-70 family)|nr:sigma-70 family RNA polymerase sigma factor [Prolixibacteraceae bacterium]MBT6763801.1 sigma-70 family RNA polymerase sigma factor [Prolixibacteraceae bacterium]MBT7000372.1 sigma-70 family RNA polymerase sigma factor [Prolixibacteraceae bacterium]MBT7393608.1 sigma-70 family RNA polymerase sigma factor [Prolixibacteraceae bacterium]